MRSGSGFLADVAVGLNELRDVRILSQRKKLKQLLGDQWFSPSQLSSSWVLQVCVSGRDLGGGVGLQRQFLLVS